MADRLTKEQRSALMRKVRQKGTQPELVVRQLLHRNGYRFRLNRADLPGTPDLVFASRKKVVFIHGCFWHRHANCRLATAPRSRVQFWQEKFQRNVERDRRVQETLGGLGWQVMVVWECEVRDLEALLGKLGKFLGPAKAR